jgi:hypothetical protein
MINLLESAGRLAGSSSRVAFPTINRRLLMHGPLDSWSWRTLLGLAIAAVVIGEPFSARAGIVVSVENASANAGSSANAFEVDLQNTGTSSVNIAGFAFEISVTSASGVTFTGADINTTVDNYIFAGNSAQGPNTATNTGTVLDASDNAITGSTTLGIGSTVALGRVFFDVASSALAGPVIVTLSPFPATTLTDPSLNNVAIDTLNNGTITILPSTSVPEPSGLISATFGLLGSAWFIWTRRRAAR